LLEVEYRERRNRLITLVQPLACLPQGVIAVGLFAASAVLVGVAWFAVLITGRWPRDAYERLSGSARFLVRYAACSLLIADRFPQLITADDPGYPARLLIGSPKERYSRLKVLMRWPYMLPAYCMFVAGFVLLVLGFVLGWVVIVCSGRQPRALFRLQLTGFRWSVHFWLIGGLVLEDYDWALSG
jgi:hypothetical protein